MSHDSKAGSQTNGSALTPERDARAPGVRTYVLLLLAMAAVTVLVSSLSLLLIRHRLREQVATDLSQDLNHSVVSFQNLEAERLSTLERENALLAELPTLKALMTSGDDLTIQDGAVDFWDLSGTDLFALADANGRIVAAYTKAATAGNSLRLGLAKVLSSQGKHYLIDDGSLYACSVRPLYFGSDESGTVLGYVISGVSIERAVRQVSQHTGVEAAFLSDGQVVASTLNASSKASLPAQSRLFPGTVQAPAEVQLDRVRFLAATVDLSEAATSPLRLVVLKSLEPAEISIRRIDRVVLSAGLVALFFGTILMIVLSRLVTHPLEGLSRSVEAFGRGDGDWVIPRRGPQEVRQLSEAFAGMRQQIQQANRALLEAERLATIGRMASSVSHDLRHYLATIYANSEFLASDRLSPKERVEIFGDVRAAVLGTTDMIESLLIFSRTGSSVKRSPELMATIVERAVALIRAHPDAEGVTVQVRPGDAAQITAVVDGKQIERAIFNLLLNASQSARLARDASQVSIILEAEEQHMIVNVIDNGAGVPEKIRDSLFEPFVSEGKQKGTGLGLTLAHCIAMEHGGAVVLLSSRPGETIFQMKVARGMRMQQEPRAPEAERHDQVTAHETARIRT